MLNHWVVYGILFVYVGLMYWVADWGDRHNLRRSQWGRGLIYAFSLAVYCTSWTFFGAVGTAATRGWDFLPIYLGPVLLFTLGWPLVLRIIRISKEKNVTSISDFIASLYGKSRRIAVLITCIAVLAAIPYIALQLEAISASLRVVTNTEMGHGDSQFRMLMIALFLALFSIAFGTKKLDVTEHHHGLMLAIAFESAIKLVAFVAVGVFVIFYLYDEPGQMVQQVRASEHIARGPSLTLNFISQTMLALMVFMCLPRQFHVTVVENEHREDLPLSRWVFIIYLVIFSLFVIPIALAGNQFLGSEVTPDLYVLSLPLKMGDTWLALLVFMGGLAAATGMVIISTIALSTMVSNDLVLPLFLKSKQYNLPQKTDLHQVLLWSRRITILVITLLAFLFYYSLDVGIPLAALGNLSFMLTVQFAPALLLGILLPNANKRAAFTGLLAGVLAWALMVFFPEWFDRSLRPDQSGILYTLGQLTGQSPPLFRLISLSLLCNFGAHLLYAGVSGWRSRQRGNLVSNPTRINTGGMRVRDLQSMVGKIIGQEYANRSYRNFFAGLNHDYDEHTAVSSPIVQFTERLLAGSIGAASARAVLTAALKSKGLAINDIVDLLDETTQAIRFNRRLIDATLDNISQGVSVVDDQLRIIAWNDQYLKLLSYPEGMVKKGMPVEDLIRFNAERGLLGARNIEREIEKRLIYLRQRTSYRFTRAFKDGRFLEIEGNPMPNNGYVTTYTDVTYYKKIEKQLRDSQNRIRFYTDNAPAMLAYVDNDQRLQFANKAYLRFFNVQQERVIGQPITRFFSDTELNKRQPFLDAAFAGETQSFEMEVEDHKGELLFVLGTYVPDRDQESDQVNGLFVIIQDITSRRKTELELERNRRYLEQRVEERTHALSEANRELEQAKQKAETANLSKTKFIADASHDLLQPFNAARLFSSLLTEQAERLPVQISETVLNLDQSLKSAENLLGALLDIAKFDAGGMTIHRSQFPIQQLLDELCIQCKSQASKRGLKLKIRASNAWVNSDSQLLYRVLQNLTINAIRYTEQGGVLVACRTRGEWLDIAVYDTGVGLSDSEQSIIFQDFQRLNHPNLREDKGLGLGLSIVERIVNQLGHALQVRSVRGQGSCFSVRVPRVAARNVAEINRTRQSAEQERFSPDKPPVLCIDNESQILTGMHKLISNWGHQVYCASDYQEAFNLLEDGVEPAVMLVDYHLDNENGIDVVQRLRGRFDPQCPVVVITADRSDALKNQVAEMGFGLLLKPIKPAPLRSLINQYSKRMH